MKDELSKQVTDLSAQITRARNDFKIRIINTFSKNIEIFSISDLYHMQDLAEKEVRKRSDH